MAPGKRPRFGRPFAYERANLADHLPVLEACRASEGFELLVYASSSSVYGDRPAYGAALREDDRVDKPASLYAATKRACELMNTTYGGMFGLPQSELRFFTMYGLRDQPDMAYYSFTWRILGGEPIEVYGEGRMRHAFTYIDDLVDGMLDRPPAAGKNRILNIGNDNPEKLTTFIALIERAMGREAIKVMRPMQPGEVIATWTDISKIRMLTGYAPKIKLADGIPPLRRVVKAARAGGLTRGIPGLHQARGYQDGSTC